MSDPDPYDLVVKNLPLPNEPFLVVLKSVLGKLKFSVEEFRDISGWKSPDPFVHYRAQDSRGSMALFHVPEELIVKSDALTALDSIASDFIGRVNGIFVFSGAKTFGFAFEQTLRRLENIWATRRPPTKGARIFKYEAIEYLADLNAKENGLGSVKEMLLFNDIFTTPAEEPLITHEQYVCLVDILEKKARVFDQVEPRRYLISLMKETKLSDRFQSDAISNFTGNIRVSVQGLLDSAQSQRKNIAEPNCTTLGSLLKPLLVEGVIDPDEQLSVATIIYRQKLYLLPEDLEDIAKKFEIPAET